MRAANVATALGLALIGGTAEAQNKSPFSRGAPPPAIDSIPRQTPRGVAVQERRQNVSPPVTPIEVDHGDHHHHGGYGHGDHHHGGHGYGGRVFGPRGYGQPYPYGYGYGYEGLSVQGPGYGFNYYNGPAYGGLPINPPVFVYPPYAYGPSYGYGAAYYPPTLPVDPDLARYQYENDWNVLSAKAADLAVKNIGDPAGAAAIPVPSSREAKLKSLRYQAQGDEAFRRQDFVKAAGLYRQAYAIAKDDGSAFFRTGYAHVATGQLASALEHFKRGLAVEPALAITGLTPDEIYGPDNGLAWTAHLGRVTRWVAEDVRDANRVFLLGILLYYDGDTRAREFLTKAWQLSGGTETALLPLLNPPQVKGVEVKEEVAAAPPVGEPVPIDGPLLGAPDVDAAEPPPLPEIPAPPEAEAPAVETDEYAPLFPLPSEQAGDTADPAAPPLPAPQTEDNPAASR